MKERTAIVLSLVWLLMGVTAWANDDGESRRAEVVLEVGEIDSSRKEHIQAQADSSRAEGEFQATADSLSTGTTRGEGGTAKRIVKKLGAGVLWGALSGLLFLLDQGLTGLNRSGGNDFGLSFFFGQLLGYTFVTPIGVSRIDQNDHYISALTGSVMGVILLTRVIEIDSAVDKRSDMWPLLASSVIGATIMSELSRLCPCVFPSLPRCGTGSPGGPGGRRHAAVLNGALEE